MNSSYFKSKFDTIVFIPTYVQVVLSQSFQKFEGKFYLLAELYTSEVLEELELRHFFYKTHHAAFLNV